MLKFEWLSPKAIYFRRCLFFHHLSFLSSCTIDVLDVSRGMKEGRLRDNGYKWVKDVQLSCQGPACQDYTRNNLGCSRASSFTSDTEERTPPEVKESRSSTWTTEWARTFPGPRGRETQAILCALRVWVTAGYLAVNNQCVLLGR